ncbi:alpha-1-inhibitor 3-like isoform X2 [Teleopsis dalmanni]|uniref:alpha-1-inhibitor 3-like isoform X2 n=1 Tax=Teleopsis dalmanni TaxID=139649 RepID=UPI0018CD039C|nr:alpha-1-inhibitor 3-like isoform X2 [Teleopsis dalmanni]
MLQVVGADDFQPVRQPVEAESEPLKKLYYSVVGPGTIRSNYKYNVAVSIHKANGPCPVKVNITGPSYNETKTAEIEPMATEKLEFDIPELEEGIYTLTASDTASNIFQNSTQLNFARYMPLTVIQTDKATYKPDDTVQFRVIFMDENTRPAKVKEPIKITITDGAKNRIQQYNNIELTSGVYTNKLKLSEQPVLGRWEISALLNNDVLTTKCFEVDKYVLPKFQVFIDTDKNVAISSGVIKVVVRAKYTFGQSVAGKATVSIKSLRHNSLESTEKTVDVDGKGYVEFDINKDLDPPLGQTSWPPVEIKAKMVETLTGNEQEAKAEVVLHPKPYRIESLSSTQVYSPGKQATYEVAIKKLDDSPLQDMENTVKLLLEQTNRYGSVDYNFGRCDNVAGNGYSVVLDAKLSSLGIARFEFVIPEQCGNFLVRCVYLDTMVRLPSLCKESPLAETRDHLKLFVQTKNPQLGKDIAVDVKSKDSIPYFIYTVIARGNIIRSEVIKVPDGQKSHTIKFPVTYSMLPKIDLMVYNIHNNEFRFDEITIDIDGDFKNSIDITAQAEAQPGEDVNLQINTDPGSFIGLLGVDQSVLLLKSGNDLNKEQIFKSFDKFKCETPSTRASFGRYPGRKSGLVTLTNAFTDYHHTLMKKRCAMPQSVGLFGAPAALGFARSSNMESVESLSIGAPGGMALPNLPQPPPPTIRKEFLENWIFENIEDSGKNIVNLTKKIPDTITSWVITGFSLNYDTGIALTKSPTTIKTFRPFFISTNLPYSVKRGEVFSVPVIIFNYMDKLLEATVTLDNSDDEYEFIDDLNDQKTRTQNVSVGSNIGETINFSIRPKKIGNITLKITAISPLAGDAIHKELKVEPEGVTIYKNYDYYLHTDESSSEFTHSTTLDIPKEIVPDSEYIEVSVMGDILGSTISNMDNLIRMPYGCGEQNMVNFVPNILVLKYLESVNQLTPTIEEKAKRFMNIGYQRELTYKHDDGSYSAFGKSDRVGSTWLTAYVMRSFKMASKYIDIDTEVLEKGLSFLSTTQAANGCFVENGKLFDFSHHNTVGLTAYVLLAFLENIEYAKNHQEAMNRGFAYLQEHAKTMENDIYALAIVVYAMQMIGMEQAESLLALLESKANVEGGHKWWSKLASSTKEEKCCYVKSNDVEITSYILMTLLARKESTLPITKWLISQRNSNGGFSSSQDTVVGLEALIKFAEKSGAGKPSFVINFGTAEKSTNTGKFEVNKENALVMQSQKVKNDTRDLFFNGKGIGAVILQVAYQFNILQNDCKPSFKLSSKICDTDVPPGKLIVHVSVEFVPLETDNGNNESNMVVMEVNLPSGYTALAESFDKIKNVPNVKRVETKNGDTVVVVYIDSLKATDVKTLPIEAIKSHDVSDQKPAPIVVYDYYDSGKRATDFYQI